MKVNLLDYFEIQVLVKDVIFGINVAEVFLKL